MGHRSKEYLVCDECGKESPQIGEGRGGFLEWGWGRKEELHGWLTLEVSRTDQQILREAKSLLSLGTATSDHYHFCGRECVKGFLKAREIPKKRVIDVTELGPKKDRT